MIAQITLATSYFAAPGIAKNPRAISISRNAPRWWGKSRQFLPLAPEMELLTLWREGRIDWSNYCEWYASQLDRLDPVEVARELNGAILCCYEREAATCHRRLAAAWLENALGITIPEL